MIKIDFTEEQINLRSSLEIKKDLIIGGIGEHIIIQYRTKYLGYEFLGKSGESELSDYDLKFRKPNGEIETDEVKNDTLVNKPERRVKLPNTDRYMTLPKHDTGNLFIEYYGYNKQRGVSVTKADNFCYILFYNNEIWEIPVERLRRLISENNFYLTSDSGDIGSGTRGYLIPREDYREHFNVIQYERNIISNPVPV